MVKTIATFCGASVNDQAKAKDFYTSKLGFKLEDETMGLRFELPGGGKLFLYPKDDHQPASYTYLNLMVDDIDEGVEQLAAAGVTFEHYDSQFVKTDAKGIARGIAQKMGPDIAWFKDPAGNILAVLQEK